MSESKSIAEEIAARFASYQGRIAAITDELNVYKDVLDISPLPMFLADPTGILIYGNVAYTALLGAPLELLLGTGWQNFVDPGVLEMVAQKWQDTVDTKAPTSSNSIVYRRRDGTRIACTYKAIKLHGDKGYCGFITPDAWPCLKTWIEQDYVPLPFCPCRAVQPGC